MAANIAATPDTAEPVDTVEPGDAVEPADTGEVDEAGDTGTADTGAAPPPALFARITASVEGGAYPLEVTFDASGSNLGSGTVRYAWAFGDGAVGGDAPVVAHTYVGKGEFQAEVTVTDEATGDVSVAAVTVDVDTPDCPHEASPVEWGELEDKLDAVSGIDTSRREPSLYWLVEDNDDDLAVVDAYGVTVSEHDLPNDCEDLEDIAVEVDPVTGTPVLFVADIGDNSANRDEVVVWVVDEPDPLLDSNLNPLRMALVYPDEPQNAETLLVDPLTFDLFIVTKDMGDEQRVFAKRAPHDAEGPFVLEDLGTFEELDMTATGGDISDDGFRIVLREYEATARLWYRDAYLPLEAAFEESPCEIEIIDDDHGEGVTFTADGTGIVTINEGDNVPLYYVAF